MKKPWNRKILYVVLLIAVLLCLAGCGAGGSGDGAGDSSGIQGSAPEGFVGLWSCEPLASDRITDTGFYELRVEENGEFSLYDAGAGNPGISGTFGNVTEDQMDAVFDTEDFDPPFCWELDETGATFDYMVSEGEIKLGYDGVWLTFHPTE